MWFHCDPAWSLVRIDPGKSLDMNASLMRGHLSPLALKPSECDISATPATAELRTLYDPQEKRKEGERRQTDTKAELRL